MKKISFFVLIIALFTSVSCGDKNVKAERKAFKELLTNTNLDGIRNYKSLFADYITEEHKQIVDSLYDVYIADSTLFVSIQEIPDSKLLIKYNKMRDYLEKYPNGINFIEASEFVSNNMDAVNRFKNQIKKFNEIVNRYDYYTENSGGYFFEFFTLEPVNDDGIGKISAYTRRSAWEWDHWKQVKDYNEYRLYEVGLINNVIELLFPNGLIVEAKISESDLSFSLNGHYLFFESHVKSELIRKSVMEDK